MMHERLGEADGRGAGHPEVDVLIGYVRGELSQHEAVSVRAHAATCVDCGDQLAALILLREERQRIEDGESPMASVTLFPAPEMAPRRRWQPAAAAAAALVLALAWFAWPARVAEQEPLVAEPEPLVAAALVVPGVEFGASGDDVRTVMDTVDMIGMRYGGDAQPAAEGVPADAYRIAAAVRAFSSGDLAAASVLLEPFGERWHRYGTAMLGSTLFLLEDPAAYQVLEMYAADHETPLWQASAGAPEDAAFFLMARLRHAMGDDVGAREAVGWIAPTIGVGPTAVAWLTDTLGESEPNAQR